MPVPEVESNSLEHHPVHAAEQLECVPALRRVAKILRHQLERYDGRGTPDGLRGDRLPLGSRVLAIASAFDLLTTTGAEKPLWKRPFEPAHINQPIANIPSSTWSPWMPVIVK